MNADAFADAVMSVRRNHGEFALRAGAARAWLIAHRGYDLLADGVAAALVPPVDERTH